MPYLKINNDGTVVPDMSYELIAPHWRTLIAEFIRWIEIYYPKQVLSLYLRGSVPRGLALDGFSDLDIIAIMPNDAPAPIDITKFAPALLQRHSFCKNIDCSSWREENVLALKPPRRYPHLAMVLKTQALHLVGHELVASLPPVKPGFDMISHAFDLPYEWAEFATALPTQTNAQLLLSCPWMGKRLLRTAFELAALDLGIFTRDLADCAAIACQTWPALTESFEQTLQLCHSPAADTQKIMASFQPLATHLLHEIHAKGWI